MTAVRPLVSIILPVFNGEPWIGDTLDSALCQTYPNIEVIVVDDGSRDRTRAVVGQRARRNSRIQVISQDNRGVAAARNRALGTASGEFIAPLDQDDLWDPTKIERQMRRMTEIGADEIGLVYCWWVWIDGAGAVLDSSPRWRIEGPAHEMLLRVNYIGSASVPLYRRRLLEEAGGYDVTLRERRAEACEDWDIALKVAERAHVAVVPSRLVAYRRHRSSMSAGTDRMWRSHALLIDSVRVRRPDVRPATIRQSRSQFALILAGVSFWCGAYGRALLWGLRGFRSSLALLVLPYVIRLFFKTLLGNRRGRRRIIRPGMRFGDWEMPQPLVPYDLIYSRRCLPTGAVVRDAIGRCLKSPAWQATAVALSFLLVAALHREADGLWFQGDAPRHAVNGLFFSDLVRMLPRHPVEFAARYYARYPVIDPATYPPLFYLIEALAFAVFGPSPHAAKLVVLIFAGMAGFYTMAWARWWIGTSAGWAGAFLAFLPGIVVWSNSVMLNMPATALSLASLYHFRRWSETTCMKQFVLAALLLVAVLLTYYQSISVLCICGAWIALMRCRVGFNRRHLLIAAAALTALVPLAAALRLAPVQAARHLPTMELLASRETWTFYWKALPEVVGGPVLALGLAGSAAGLLIARWRTESAYVTIWIVALIVSLSLLPAKNPRYILLVAPAFVIAATLGVRVAVSFLRLLNPPLNPGWLATALAASLVLGFWSAAHVRVPQVAGFREMAAYLRQQAPKDAVLYDGNYEGLFGFYVRALDPDFERRLVRADKLLYQRGPASTFRWIQKSNVSSTDDVVTLLRTRSGCKWVAIEVGTSPGSGSGRRLLRQAVARPEFELVRSFPITGAGPRRVDLYRMVEAVEPIASVDLSFPSFNDHVFRHIIPITR